MFAYNIKTGQPTRRQKSPLEESVWLIPAGCVDVEPPIFNAETQICQWDGVQWVISDIPQPEPIPEPEPVSAIDQLRSQRNALLSETDWWCLSDRNPTNEQLIYRQQLRDLPANSTPALDENGQLTGVDWPTPPIT